MLMTRIAIHNTLPLETHLYEIGFAVGCHSIRESLLDFIDSTVDDTEFFTAVHLDDGMAIVAKDDRLNLIRPKHFYTSQCPSGRRTDTVSFNNTRRVVMLIFVLIFEDNDV